ncbi:MAG: L-aspartate oxidase [Desulfovibrio sp.]|jgi:L-aspartate oxidase|nr:L-aspartate oxidase [Desulfovibrio sp.]
MEAQRLYTQVLIIGAGLAGSVAALRLADKGIQVSLLAAGDDVENANSWLAQGGIIYRSEDRDDARLLAEDIFIAGHRHNAPEAVWFLAREGPPAVREMLVERVGAHFDRQHTDGHVEEEWDLTREGGHSRQRILHSADHTGRTIMEAVRAAVLRNPSITVLQGCTAVDLLTSHHHTRGMTYRYQLENRCCGAYVYREDSGLVATMLADVTILATGGAGQVYLHTTNAPSAVGSGIAMASRAFVRLENMEFVQFHPTTLYHLDPRRELITEALRGEGAHLVDSRGRRFMAAHDSRGELAPRDIVARSIVEEMLASGDPCVYLDVSPVRQNLEKRFPTVLHSCRERGIDVHAQPIPVVPAAHYFCGGILTDLAGRTTLERLYSVGECSCTGVHGANRLASTSLLEALLWGVSAAEDIAARLSGGLESLHRVHEAIVDWQPQGDEKNDDPALLAQDWTAIRNIMWNYVGISRTNSRLIRAFNELRDLSRTLHDFYNSTPLSKPLIDLFHGCLTACLITQAALRNTRDLGCHHRV